MKEEGKLRICVGASAGGHMNQMLKLLEISERWPESPSFCVTTMKELAEKMERWGPVYIIGECNRYHPLKTLVVFIRSLRIMVREHPDVVITTGSLPLAMICISAKLLGAKIVWIDSIANLECLSMSGRIVRYFADLFLAQWPELSEKYKNVEYVGAIL